MKDFLEDHLIDKGNIDKRYDNNISNKSILYMLLSISFIFITSYLSKKDLFIYIFINRFIEYLRINCIINIVVFII
jgi:hypothetical protein